MDLEIYSVDSDYVDSLNQIDPKVEYHHGDNDRPYIGIVLQINSLNYFVPLSSPKNKHHKMK
ncbi:hypothetical protein XA3_15800 [Xylocopilactobacillus apicola]|uniref:Uncharacterized protein n=1 Tax=Xylocopilactobacillus apicola TaxID=2932184 RepID=A0AAU9D5P7_9LACO|nr:hypothetical protein XA3_15800 [Xylocopilactobacillus apicola]